MSTQLFDLPEAHPAKAFPFAVRGTGPLGASVAAHFPRDTAPLMTVVVCDDTDDDAIRAATVLAAEGRETAALSLAVVVTSADAEPRWIDPTDTHRSALRSAVNTVLLCPDRQPGNVARLQHTITTLLRLVQERGVICVDLADVRFVLQGPRGLGRFTTVTVDNTADLAAVVDRAMMPVSATSRSAPRLLQIFEHDADLGVVELTAMIESVPRLNALEDYIFGLVQTPGLGAQRRVALFTCCEYDEG